MSLCSQIRSLVIFFISLGPLRSYIYLEAELPLPFVIITFLAYTSMLVTHSFYLSLSCKT